MSLVKLHVLWQILRPRTLIIIWLHVCLGYILVSSELPGAIDVILVLLATALAYMHAVAINDISDEAVDSLNAKLLEADNDRPLLTHSVTIRELKYISGVIAVLFLIVCAFISWWMIPVAVVLLFLNMAYSLEPIRISARGIYAQLLLPFMYVVFPMIAAIGAVGEVTVPFFVVMIGAYLMFVGRLLLKDIRDEDGDRQAQKLTFLVRRGLRPTLLLSFIFLTGGIIVSFIQLLVLDASEWAGMGIAVIIAIVGSAWALKHCYDESKLEYKLLYVGMVGRFASMWTFFIVMHILIGLSHVTVWQQLFFEVITIGIFLAGIRVLHEELIVVKSKSVRAKRR